MNIISEINQLPVIAPRPKVLQDRRQLERRSRWRLDLPVAGEKDRREARERRATPRLEVELDCEERFEGTRYFRITRDLSTFGVSTRCGYPHPVGTKLDLALYLPDDPRVPVKVQAEVVGWHSEDGGMRLAFRSPSAEAVRRIHRYLQTRVAESRVSAAARRR